MSKNRAGFYIIESIDKTLSSPAMMADSESGVLVELPPSESEQFDVSNKCPNGRTHSGIS
jgi:hypothetical protein